MVFAIGRARFTWNPARAALLTAAALATMLAVQPLQAGPATCRQIEAQLASTGADPRAARKYDRAIRAQRLELQKISAQLANAGCGGLFAALRPQCGMLKETMRRMERNLSSLEQARARLPAGPSQAERRRLQAAYARSGCTADAELETAALPKLNDEQPSLYDRLFGRRDNGQASGEPASGGELRGAFSARQPYRALCVRACDGYFFPVAFSSSPLNFTNDQQACEAACPGTETEVYYDEVPDEDGSKMRSGRTGAPYAELPTAFLYKRAGYKRPAACGCNPRKDFSVVAGAKPEPDDSEALASAPALDSEASSGAPDQDGSPIVRDDALTAPVEEAAAPEEPVATSEKTASVEPDETRKKPVRVVGPKFLPDPEEAIDLRAPGRTHGL